MLAWTATPDRFAFNKSSTLPQQRIRRLAEAEKENWHKRSVHANLQNVARNLERAKRRLRISRPGVRVPSIAPKNAVRPKGLAAFLFVLPGRKCWRGRGGGFCAAEGKKAGGRRDRRAFAGLLFVHLLGALCTKGPSGRPAGAAQRGAGGRKGMLDSGGGG